MTDGKDQSPLSRSVVVTAILLVAAAVLLVALRPWLTDEPDVVDGGASLESGAGQVAFPGTDSIPDAQAVDAAVGAEAPVPIGVVPPARGRVVVLPARLENPDPTAAAVLDAVRQATLRALHASRSVDIVDVSTAELTDVVPQNAGYLAENDVFALAVLRRFDAGVVAEFSERSEPDGPFLGFMLETRQANGSRSNAFSALSRSGDAGFGTVPEALRAGGNDPESLGATFAQHILRLVEQATLSSAAPPEARVALLDASRPEAERLRSLFELGGRGQALDAEAVAAAVDLGTRSPSASTRRMAWGLLRRAAYDPALAQPLSVALLSDPDAAVRREAAFALATYRGDGISQSSLAHAMHNDGSADVRLAAQLSMMDVQQQQVFSRETLRDKNLTPAERLAPATLLRQAGNSPMVVLTAGDADVADAHAYAEIVSLTDDPGLKVRALQELQRTINPFTLRAGQRPGPDVTRALIDSAKVENEDVRRAALGSLRLLSDDPEARAVLESVVENEPRLAEELRIPDALERSVPGETQ